MKIEPFVTSEGNERAGSITEVQEAVRLNSARRSGSRWSKLARQTARRKTPMPAGYAQARGCSGQMRLERNAAAPPPPPHGGSEDPIASPHDQMAVGGRLLVAHVLDLSEVDASDPHDQAGWVTPASSAHRHPCGLVALPCLIQLMDLAVQDLEFSPAIRIVSTAL